MSKVKTAKTKAEKLNANSKIWEVLTEAKKHLSDDLSSYEEDLAGKCTYICYAASYALCRHPYNQSEENSSKAHKYILDQLYPNSSLEAWLHENHGLTMCELLSSEGRKKTQATRKAWLDHMIETCKAQNI